MLSVLLCKSLCLICIFFWTASIDQTQANNHFDWNQYIARVQKDSPHGQLKNIKKSIVKVLSGKYGNKPHIFPRFVATT